MPWYLVNQEQIRLDLLQNGVRAGINEGDPAVGTLASNVWYLQVLSKTQLDVVLILFLMAGLVGLGLWRYESLRRNAYPLLTIIGTIGIFTLLRNKDVRYTMPMLSSMAVLSTYWITQIRHRRVRQGLGVFLGVYCVLLFWLTSFGARWFGTIWLNGYGSYYYSDVYNVPLMSVKKADYMLEQIPAGGTFNGTRGETIKHYPLPDGSSLYLVKLAHTPAS